MRSHFHADDQRRISGYKVECKRRRFPVVSCTVKVHEQTVILVPRQSSPHSCRYVSRCGSSISGIPMISHNTAAFFLPPVEFGAPSSSMGLRQLGAVLTPLMKNDFDNSYTFSRSLPWSLLSPITLMMSLMDTLALYCSALVHRALISSDCFAVTSGLWYYPTQCCVSHCIYI